MWKPQHFSTPKQQKKERKIYCFIFLSSNYQNMQHFSLLTVIPFSFFFNSQDSKTTYQFNKSPLELFSLEIEYFVIIFYS